MSHTKKLLKNTAIIAIGKLSTQVVSFLLLPVYTSVLSTAEYGEYDFVMTLSLFIVPVITLLMEESMFRFLIDASNEKEMSKVISQTFVFTIISCFFFSLLCYFVGFKIFNFKYTLELIIINCATIIMGLSNSLARGVGNIKLYSFSNFIASLLTIIFNVLFIVYLNLGLLGMLYGYAISNFIAAVFTFVVMNTHKYVKLSNFDKVMMNEMVRYSIPLVPNSISWVIMNMSSRLIITTTMGNSANGVFSIASKFPNLINTLYGFFYTSWKETASRSIKDSNHESFYNFIYANLKRLLISLVVMMISVMPFAFSFLINESYSEAYYYIPLLSISMYFANLSGFYGGIFTAYKDTKILGTTTVIGAFVNVIVTIFFIKHIGIYAAALGSMVSNIITNSIRYKKVIEVEKLNSDKKLYAMTFVVLIIILATYYYNEIYSNIFALILSTLFCIFINKELIFNIIAKLRNIPRIS
ncbi:hypothetical protein A4S06_08430 [Erysipelotrichaceae bacterium MTC7]|nr:hypothetical protein A4S06_08430 [Erysipelotrichaceae bacterium MTC7]